MKWKGKKKNSSVLSPFLFGCSRDWRMENREKKQNEKMFDLYQTNKTIKILSLAKLHSNDVRFLYALLFCCFSHAHQLENSQINMTREDCCSLPVDFSASDCRGIGKRFENNQNEKTLSFYNSSNTNTMFDEPYHNFVRHFSLFMLRQKLAEDERTKENPRHEKMGKK